MGSSVRNASTLPDPALVLNPLTPMAFLPPDIARETAVAGYIIVGTLAILIWDIINNLYGDYKLLFKYRIRLPTITYFVSRISSLGYVLWSAIYYTAPIGNCFKNEKGLGALYPVSVSASALLFFFRVRIVWDKNNYVVAFFFFLWLSVVGGTLTAAFGVTGVNIGPTDYCLNAAIENYVTAAAIIPLIHDTLVFLAITYRLASNSHVDSNIRRGFRVAFSGAYLPGVSKALLKDGQTYYLVTVLSNLLTVIMVHMSSVPVTYRTIFSAPNIMLINVMACRVFRNIKFGVFKRSTYATSNMISTEIKAAAILPVSFRHSMPINEETETDTVTLGRTDTNPPTPAPTLLGQGIDMKKTVEQTTSEYQLDTFPSSRKHRELDF